MRLESICHCFLPLAKLNTIIGMIITLHRLLAVYKTRVVCWVAHHYKHLLLHVINSGVGMIIIHAALDSGHGCSQ